MSIYDFDERCWYFYKLIVQSSWIIRLTEWYALRYYIAGKNELYHCQVWSSNTLSLCVTIKSSSFSREDNSVTLQWLWRVENLKLWFIFRCYDVTGTFSWQSLAMKINNKPICYPFYLIHWNFTDCFWSKKCSEVRNAHQNRGLKGSKWVVKLASMFARPWWQEVDQVMRHSQ